MKTYTLEQANNLVMSYYKDNNRTMPFPKHLKTLEQMLSPEGRAWVIAGSKDATEEGTEEALYYISNN